MLKTILLAVLLSACAHPNHDYPKTGRLETFDPSFKLVVDPQSQIEMLADGMKWTEGPVWDAENHRLLFSDPAMNIIFSWDEKHGKQTFLDPSGYDGQNRYSDEPGTNGLLINGAGELIACDHGNRRISKIDLKTKKKSSLAEQWEGKRFNSPNDICAHPAGYYFFTDPPYGLPNRESDTTNRQIPVNGVYRTDVKGNSKLLVSNLSRPNGIALSADANTLFVAISDGSQPYIMAYTLEDAELKGEGRVFFDFKKNFPKESMGADGIKFDKHGNLFAAAGNSVIVINPQGKAIGRIHTEIPTSNCAFGADGYLYMTTNDKLMRIKVNN